MKQVKERGFHFQINIVETKERSDEWYYRKRKILKERNEQEKVLKNNHDHSTTEYSRFKKTLRKIKQKYYWNKIIEDIKRHVQECLEC